MNTSAAKLVDLLGLQRPPVAIGFRDTIPTGVDRIEEAAPSGCTYWKHAAEGRTFYTLASDHFGCPVGSYTHGIDLPPAQQQELQGLVATMVGLGYIDAQEVPSIPRRETPFSVAVYAPWEQADFEPDVVLVCGNARQMMLLAEAAHAAGVDCDGSMVGRPTCAAIPAVMKSGRTATNLGCIGNRVYTALPDDQLYFAVAGPQVNRVVEKLSVITNANRELEKFHRSRKVER
jgi:uncharacterized protein (DUF169 family)